MNADGFIMVFVGNQGVPRARGDNRRQAVDIYDMRFIDRRDP